MTRYQNLSRSLDDLADLAMDRYLRRILNFHLAADGRRYYKGAGIDDEVLHHGERWTHEPPPEGSAYFHAHSPQWWRDHFRERLSHAFSPWDPVKLPSADTFRTYYEIMFEAARRGCPVVSATGSVGNGNADLSQAFRTLNRTIGEFKGQTRNKFAARYLDGLDTMLINQTCVATLLGASLRYEGRIWDRVERDLSNLVDEAFDAMDFDRDSGGSPKKALQVAAAAANVGALIAGSPVLKVAGTAFGALATLAPDGEGKDSNSLAAEHPDEIINHIAERLGAINGWVRAHERGIAKALAKGAGTVDRDLSHYDLARPRKLLRETDRDGLFLTPDEQPLSSDQREVLRADRDSVRTLCNEGMRRIADELDSAKHRADRGSSESIWLRTGDDVGIGRYGPREQWDDLFDRYRHAIASTATELREAAQHFEIAITHLFDTDEEVNADLRRHSKQIHA
jgi:hypothetical protein